MPTQEITAKNLVDTVKKPGIVLLDFWASWCGPCRAFTPIFEGVAARHPDVVFGKVDTEAEAELAAAFDIRSIPTLMAFRDGVLVFSQPGMLPAPALEQLLTKVRALDMVALLASVEEAAAPASAKESAAPTSAQARAATSHAR
jgi:thioredoxin 1